MNKKLFDDFVSLIKEELSKKPKLKPEEKTRLEEEIKFIALHESIYEDFMCFLELKKTGKIGNKNNPNSILFYLLGITSKKPDISKDFRFSYTLDKDSSRVSPPDVDIDFEKRDEILTYLCNKYGDDHVALIGVSIGYKPKAAVQMVAKALNLTNSQRDGDKRFSSENDQEAKRISKIMPDIPDMGLKQWLGKDPKFKPKNSLIESAMELLEIEQKKFPAVFKYAEELEGKIKSHGTHPAGVVISKDPIDKDIPLHYTKVFKQDNLIDNDIELLNEEVIINNKRLPITQYDMKEVEELGLLKFDFLQIETLRQIKFLIRNLIPNFDFKGKITDKNKKLITIEEDKTYSLNFDIDNLDTKDKNVLKTIDELKLEGLFQLSGKVFKSHYYQDKNWNTGELLFEEDGSPKMKYQKGLIEVIGCNSFEDIVVSNAIGRPGPLKSKVHHEYAKNKKNQDKIVYLHPKLEEILKPTYSLLCYQEQLIQMAMALAGFTFAQADKLRRACAKKDLTLLVDIEIMFREGCKKNKITTDIVDNMWDICIKFGSYAFGLAHSCAYGYIAYQTAFLKTYFPTEFICAIMSSSVSDNDKLGIIRKSFQNEYDDLVVLPPDINLSKNYYVPSGYLQIVAPFSAVKGLGSKVSDILVQKQPFSSIYDFVLKAGGIGEGTVENLIDIGIFRSFGDKELIMSEYKRNQSIRKRVIKTSSGGGDPSVFTGSLF